MASEGNQGAGAGPGDDNPRAHLMREVAEQMEAIEADFGEDFQIGRVITIVEVMGPDGEVGLRIRAGQLPWVTMGMLRFALRSVEGQIEA